MKYSVYIQLKKNWKVKDFSYSNRLGLKRIENHACGISDVRNELVIAEDG